MHQVPTESCTNCSPFSQRSGFGRWIAASKASGFASGGSLLALGFGYFSLLSNSVVLILLLVILPLFFWDRFTNLRGICLDFLDLLQSSFFFGSLFLGVQGSSPLVETSVAVSVGAAFRFRLDFASDSTPGPLLLFTLFFSLPFPFPFPFPFPVFLALLALPFLPFPLPFVAFLFLVVRLPLHPLGAPHQTPPNERLAPGKRCGGSREDKQCMFSICNVFLSM